MSRAPAIKPNGFENMREIQREFRFQDSIDGAEHRGISVAQLRRVILWCQIQCFNWREQLKRGSLPAPSKENLDFHFMMKWLIRPATQPNACAFLEMLTDQRQTPVWFVSHVWNGTIAGFLKCVEEHYKTRDIQTVFEDSPYWVCAFAIREHSQDEEFKAGPEKSGFYEATNLSTGMLLILGADESSSPFTRTWCALELSAAMDSAKRQETFLLLDVAIDQEQKAQLLTTGMTQRETALEEQQVGAGTWAKECREKGFPIEILCKGLSFELQRTEVTAPEEEDESDAEEEDEDPLEQAMKNLSKANAELSKIKAEPKDFRSELLNYIAGRVDKQGLLSRAPALSAHENYTELNMKIRAEVARCAWRRALLHAWGSDGHAAGLVEELGLPGTLAADTSREVLVWDYFGCEEMGDADLVSLAKGVPPRGIAKLECNFCKCSRIDDRGVAALASALPSSVRILLLDFSHCGKITDACLAALGRTLPSSLESLRLRFKGGRSEITNGGLQGLSKAFPTSLHTLELDFATCEKIGQTGIEALSERLMLMPALRTLNLDFWMCGAINNDGGVHGELGGIQMLAEALPELLETLQLRFTGIRGDFNDKGVQLLSQNLPRELKVLKLDLLYFDRLGDKGLDALGQNLPATLHTLQLKVEGCDRITDSGITLLCDGISNIDLHTLVLQFEFCGQITSQGISEMAEKLPSSLQSLSLNFGSCREIKDDGLIALAEKLPGSLQKFHLDLKYCKKIGDMGLAALGKNLPASLIDLSLHFGDCELIYDAGIVALSSGLPQTIKWLEINLWRCRNVGDTGVSYIAKSLPSSCKVLLLTVDGTKVSSEKRAFCNGVESMRRCKVSAADLMAPPSQPDRRMHNQSQIGWLRRHGPNLAGVDEVLSRELPVLEAVSPKLLMKLTSGLSRSVSKSSMMSKSQSLPSLQRKKPPISAQKFMSRALR